ncbi:hypothetical protein HPB52_018404 [Rhipicephalus sanguineus]|uniref:Major facilitator superfamily (MFS) profile domain-containing protein n=1 Tax=Rhipicephalus sanguineus TaxID=34632 RepID=A0A9D4Q1Q2_RHISA|nr:hypothetical protein HPB52_018404 [Rhipicephalus sanguineus]
MDGLEELERRLNVANVSEALSNLREVDDVELTLPLFRAKQVIDLKDTLSSLGFGAWYTDELQPLHASEPGPHAVSAARHASAFRVCTKGGAAQVTKTKPPKGKAAAGRRYTVDRPFLFMVTCSDPDAMLLLETILCEEWEYGDDNEPARTSAVSDWNLVCQRDTLIVVMVAVHCFGSSVFSAAAGSLADSVGRMPVLLVGTAVLIVSTVIGCLSRSFHAFVAAKFFSSGGVSAVMITAVTSVFEVTTRSNRPLQIIFAGMLGVLFSDMWDATVAPVKIGWRLRHAVYTLPTALMLPAFCVASESPRWLIARGRFKDAEVVMMNAAAVNHFPMHFTALTIDKLKAQLIRNEVRLPSIDQEMFSGYSMRRRALVLSLSYFSITFAAFVSAFSLVQRKESWLDHVSFTMNIVCYAVMDRLITRFSMVTVLNIWFMTLGALQCLMSLAFGVGGGAVCPILIMVTIALFYSGSMLCLVYVQEIFPTAVRGSAVGLVFACGRLGGLSSIAGQALNQ